MLDSIFYTGRLSIDSTYPDCFPMHSWDKKNLVLPFCLIPSSQKCRTPHNMPWGAQLIPMVSTRALPKKPRTRKGPPSCRPGVAQQGPAREWDVAPSPPTTLGSALSHQGPPRGPLRTAAGGRGAPAQRLAPSFIINVCWCTALRLSGSLGMSWFLSCY